MSSNLREDVYQKTFDDIIEFYNFHSSVFENFEKHTGVNVWFLNHFRTYMNYRNSILNVKTNGKQTTVNIFHKGFRFFLKTIIILFSFKKTNIACSSTLVFSNSLEKNKNDNKFFNELITDFTVIHNLPLFDLKTKVVYRKSPSKGILDTDSIFLSFILKFTFFSELITFNKLLKKLKHDLNLELKNRESKYHVINSFFWKNTLFFFLCFLRYRSLEVFFNKNKIKGVLLIDENSPQQKVIQYAAAKNNVKIFSFQHGNIHQLHPAYIYGKYNIKPLLPFITFTWGTYFTDLLNIKGGYPLSQLKTVGKLQPNNSLKVNQSALLQKDNIILYCSQPQRDPNIRYQMFKDILWCVKNMNKRCKLIVRPHPHELDDVFFNDIAEEVDFFDFIIDRESSLEAHFTVCKLLMVAFSTVGTEFIPYHKPMLVLDYLNQDLINWIGEGVGIPIRNKNDLLIQLNKDDIMIDKKVYSLFINKYYITGSEVLVDVKKTIYESI